METPGDGEAETAAVAATMGVCDGVVQKSRLVTKPATLRRLRRSHPS